MHILAVDTATKTCSVALTSDEAVLAETLCYSRQHHSEKILLLIDSLLAAAGVARKDIDLVAVAAGPGSFTGLRVGISTGQGFALALDRPLLGVPSLEIIAHQALPAPCICPMLDARKGQVYTCLYACAPHGGLEKTADDAVVEAGAWARALSGAVLFTGPGALLYRDRILQAFTGTALFAPASACMSRASTLAAIARKQYAAGRSWPPERVIARYVRPPDAMPPQAAAQK